MTNSAVKTRFAPSPTGHMHLGNARTALFNALLAGKEGGGMLLRIEDTDATRNYAPHVPQILEDLQWLGIPWTEGEGMGGEHGPYRQSERQAVYDEYYEKLRQTGRAYPCFCSPNTLKMARKAQLAAGNAPRYPGTCANLDPADVEARLADGESATLRFRVPEGLDIHFEDLVRGEQAFHAEDIGDFIIRRADGSPSFFFSNAVDDALMGVTHALRGEDHLTNTPRQLMLLEALKLPAPRYGHFPMVVGADGKPLSKREGDSSVVEFMRAGYLPLALSNYLARLGHHYQSEGFKTWQQLANEFDTNHLGRAPARFDSIQLDYWQKEAVHAMSTTEFENWVGDSVMATVPEKARPEFSSAIKPNVLLPADAASWAAIIFNDELENHEQVAGNPVVKEAGAEFFAAAAEAVNKFGVDYEKVTGAIRAATGAKGKALFKPLRLALTGCDQGPELEKLLQLIGAAVAARRFRRLSS